jgi:hypothetical protein
MFTSIGKQMNKALIFLVSFSAGALFGDAFIISSMGSLSEVATSQISL